jgi:glycolate oxidase FAD binding subunit
VAAVQSACAKLGGERMGDAQARPDWQACREQQLPWFAERGERDLWRLSVPQTAPVLDLPEPPFVEWHGAQRWVRTSPAQGAQVRAAAIAAGGHATLFRTAAATKVQRQTPLSAPLDAIQRELKRQFDPAAIFNPGRLYPHF